MLAPKFIVLVIIWGCAKEPRKERTNGRHHKTIETIATEKTESVGQKTIEKQHFNSIYS